jgi:Sigma-70 region 2
MVGPSFTAVLDAAAAGDEAAFRVLWRDLQPGLLRYLDALAPGASEDLASETWLRVVDGLARFSGDERAFRAWAFTVARHRAVDRWRRRTRPRDQAEVVLLRVVAGLDVARSPPSPANAPTPSGSSPIAPSAASPGDWTPMTGSGGRCNGMGTEDVFPAEMPDDPTSPIDPLDEDLVERLLAGRLDPLDAPPAYAAVARLLQAAAAPPTPGRAGRRARGPGRLPLAPGAAVPGGRPRTGVGGRSRRRLVAVALAGALVAGGLWTAQGAALVPGLRSPTGGPRPVGRVRAHPASGEPDPGGRGLRGWSPGRCGWPGWRRQGSRARARPSRRGATG